MPRAPAVRPLYAALEGPVSTLYAEVVERARAEKHLLPGTPGALTQRERPGSGAYWYRRYYDSPGTPQSEEFVGRQDDAAAADAMRSRIAAAEWTQEQIRSLRHLGMQVADKDAARVLVELHNRGLFSAGLAMVGTLAYMAWLNALGVRAVVSRTQDIDLARRQPLELAAPVSLLETLQATRLGFSAIPGLTADAPSTSAKRSGKEGLRVDVLVPGAALGRVLEVPELAWHARTIPHLDYLLSGPRGVAVLAGGHCVPVNAPAPERMAWHKLYSSTRRVNDTAKADKDLQQAATLLAVLVERDGSSLARTTANVPPALLAAARRRLPALRSRLAPHPEALEEVERALHDAAAG